MNNRWMKTGLVMSLCIILAGCSVKEEFGQIAEDPDAKSEIIIGATLASRESPYQQAISEHMLAKAEAEGITLLLDYADWDVEIQTQQLDDYRKQKVDAVIFVPVNTKAVQMPLKRLKEDRIPVINLNMRVDAVSSVYIDTYVGASNSEEASLAAEMVIELMGNEGGQIGIIEGAPGSDAQIYRTQTFVEQLTAHPQIEIAALGKGGWDREKARLAAWDMLTKYPDLQVIYCHDSDMAMGAIAAVEELNLQKQVAVIGISESEEYIKAVQEGRLYGFVTQPPEYEGITGIEKAIDAANGMTLRPWYKSPIQIITGDNVEQFIRKNNI